MFYIAVLSFLAFFWYICIRWEKAKIKAQQRKRDEALRARLNNHTGCSPKERTKQEYVKERNCRIAEAKIEAYQKQQKKKQQQEERQKNMTPDQIAHREFMAQQRRLMTDSLRYDVMRRDGFRCQLCGMTAKDGIKLHVDHIVAVSKGGKTEPSNLRTLCERCNLGKSDKTE